MEDWDFLDNVAMLVQQGKYNFAVCPTVTGYPGPFHKEDVAAALMTSNGVISRAADLLGRRRHALNSYIHRNKDVLLFFEDLRNANIDIVERSAMDMALEGDPGMVRFILQTLGKTRGYSTRHETTGADGGPVDVAMSAPSERLKEMLGQLANKPKVEKT